MSSQPCKVPGCPALASRDGLCGAHAKMPSAELRDAMQITFGMVAPLRRVDMDRIERE